MKKVLVGIVFLALFLAGLATMQLVLGAEVRYASASLPEVQAHAEREGLRLVSSEEAAYVSSSLTLLSEAAQAIRIRVEDGGRGQAANGSAYFDLVKSDPKLLESSITLLENSEFTLGPVEGRAVVHEDIRLIINFILAAGIMDADRRDFLAASERFSVISQFLGRVFRLIEQGDYRYVLKNRLDVQQSLMRLVVKYDRDPRAIDFVRLELRRLPRFVSYREIAQVNLDADLEFANKLKASDLEMMNFESEEMSRMFKSGTPKVPGGDTGQRAMSARVYEFWGQFLNRMRVNRTPLSKLKAAQEQQERLRAVTGASYTAIKLRFPETLALVSDLESIEGWDQCARVSVELFDIRRRTGSFPESLPSSLSPQDPFATAPLRYSRLGSGFKVYSVGADGEDSNGPILKGMNRLGEGNDDFGFVHNPTQVDSEGIPVGMAEVKGRR